MVRLKIVISWQVHIQDQTVYCCNINSIWLWLWVYYNVFNNFHTFKKCNWSVRFDVFPAPAKSKVQETIYDDNLYQALYIHATFWWLQHLETFIYIYIYSSEITCESIFWYMVQVLCVCDSSYQAPPPSFFSSGLVQQKSKQFVVSSE